MTPKADAHMREMGVSEEVIAKAEDPDAYIALQPSAAEAQCDFDQIRGNGRHSVHSP